MKLKTQISKIIFYFSTIWVFFHSELVFGFDVGYSRSQSSTSNSDRVNIGIPFLKQHKITASGSVTTDTSGTVADTKSNSIKIGYRFKTRGQTYWTVDYKKTDETYFYNGSGYSLKTSFILKQFKVYPDIKPLKAISAGESDSDSDSDYEATESIEEEKTFTEYITRLGLKAEATQKTYSPNTTVNAESEQFSTTGLTVNIDQDLPFGFLITAGFTRFSNTAKGTNSSRALDDKPIIISDISTTATYLLSSSWSVGLEYGSDSFTVGIGYSKDRPQLSSQAEYSSSDLSAEYMITNNLAVNASYSVARSQNSTSTSSSVLGGLSYSF